MIMKLKLCTTSKIFGKIYLKTIRDIFFRYLVCNQGKDGVRYEGKRDDSIYWWGASEPSPVPPVVANPDPPWKYPEECPWSDYCNNFEKSERGSSFLQSNKFTACEVRNWKEVAKSLMVFILHKVIHPFQSKKYLRT